MEVCMPSKKIDKTAILEATFEIAKKDGFASITLRSVVKHLRCSVAPLCLNFKTIDYLIQ
jgi:AcrR family transcriptional regulator